MIGAKARARFWQFAAKIAKPLPMSRTAKRLPLLLVALIGVLGLSRVAMAEELGSSGDWLAMTYQDGDKKLCYAISAPNKIGGQLSGRGPVGVLVTHLNGGSAKNQVSAALGYKPKSGSLVRLIIDGKPFILRKVDGDRAWAKDAVADDLILRSMRRGRRMLLTGETEDGQKIEDSFSLNGLSKSVRMAAGACGIE